MRRLTILFAAVIVLLCGCEDNTIEPPVDTEVTKNILYTDIPSYNSPYESRFYNLNHILDDLTGYTKAEKGADLTSMKRFVFTYEDPWFFEASDGGFGFLLDCHSNRMYFGTSGITNVLSAYQYVDLKPEDITELIAVLEEVEWQSWSRYTLDKSPVCKTAIEYQDGSIEQHFGNGKSEQMKTLYEYMINLSETAEARMLEDRQTTVFLDYLITWKYDYTFEEITLEDAERIVVFQSQAEEARTDHSRQPQKTLFLDVTNKMLYYEPEMPIYEHYNTASVSTALTDDIYEKICELLLAHVKNWTVNEPYIGSEESIKIAIGYDIPAWSVAIQYSDGTIAHYMGDGWGENGWPENYKEFFSAIWAIFD